MPNYLYHALNGNGELFLVMIAASMSSVLHLRDGSMPPTASRAAEFHVSKRALGCMIGFAGPSAIVAISNVVGELIVSIMTAAISVSQPVG